MDVVIFRLGHFGCGDFFGGFSEVLVEVEFGVSLVKEISEEAVAVGVEVVYVTVLPPVA